MGTVILAFLFVAISVDK